MKIKNWKGLLVFAMLGALLLGCALLAFPCAALAEEGETPDETETATLSFELPEEKLPEAVAFIQACMDAPPFPEMDVPIVAEAAYGLDFGHMKEME